MEDVLSKIKLIVVDIDGTLTRSDKTISSYTKEVFENAKKQGYCIVICTGRPLIYAVEKSKLSNAGNYVIADNGATIYDYKHDEIIHENVISKDIIKKLYEFTEENNMFYILNSVNARYENKKAFYHKKYSKNIAKIKIINSADDLNDKFTQAVIQCREYSNKEKLLKIISELKEVKINNSNGNGADFWCDINNIDVNKGNGIEILLQKLGVAKENVICFGDHWNDYSMFDACGVKVAMKNAVQLLKDRADFIADTNNNDGVAKFIDKHLLKEKIGNR